jgi:hypothetical protein
LAAKGRQRRATIVFALRALRETKLNSEESKKGNPSTDCPFGFKVGMAKIEGYDFIVHNQKDDSFILYTKVNTVLIYSGFINLFTYKK